MKSIFVVLATILAVTLPIGAAGLARTVLVANVPFDFYYGDKFFPAGEYNIVQGMEANAIVTLQSVDGKISGWVPGIRREHPANSKREPSLLFAKYSDGKSYLREARHPVLQSSYFPPSRSEREAVRRLNLGAGPTPVILSVRVH